MTLALALIAAVVGPLGIVLGWYLNERSAERRYQRQLKQIRQDAEEGRLVAITRQARKVAGELRGMAGGIYILKSRGHSMTDQMQASMEEFNTLWRELEAMSSEADVLGSAWVVEAVDPLLGVGRDMMETMMRMQQRFTASDVDLVQRQIEQVDEAVESLTTSVRQHLVVPAAK